MRTSKHFFILTLILFHAGVAHGESEDRLRSCEEQLQFNFKDAAVLVMAPKGSSKEEKRIMDLVKMDSKRRGFSSYFGIDLLEEFVHETPRRSFRFIKVISSGSDQIQILLYEGKVTGFRRTLKSAEIELASHSEPIRIGVGDLDLFFVR